MFSVQLLTGRERETNQPSSSVENITFAICGVNDKLFCWNALSQINDQKHDKTQKTVTLYTQN